MVTAISNGPDRTTDARKNWAANQAALLSVELAVAPTAISGEHWTTARDGSITTRGTDGRWLAGCSVPLLAGRSLLKTLEPGNGLAVCVLHPEHAGIVRACREIIGPGAVMFVLHPESAAAEHVLPAHDFSADIRSHRIGFFFGPDWVRQLKRHLDRFSGIATPARFVRTRLTPDPTVTEMIAEAQAVFRDVSVDRGARLAKLKASQNLRVEIAPGNFLGSAPRTAMPRWEQTIRSSPPKTPVGPATDKDAGRRVADGHPNSTGRTLVIGPSRFQLWRPSIDDLAGLTAVAGSTPVRFDTDDALNGSPLALATAADACDSVFAADVFRSAAADLVSTDTAWVTWVTRLVIPPFDTAGPRDSIMLADPAWSQIARKAGWPADRIGLHPHPPAVSVVLPTTPLVGVIGHYTKPVQPESVSTFSSHRILWEAIENQLLENPAAIGDDPANYLADRAGRMNLDPGELDQAAFLDRLIVQSCQRGLATLLVRSGLPVALFGRGWIDEPALADFAAGDLESKSDVENAVARCTALVHILPIPGAHPIDALGRVVVRPRSAEPFLRTVKRAIATGTA